MDIRQSKFYVIDTAHQVVLLDLHILFYLRDNNQNHSFFSKHTL